MYHTFEALAKRYFGTRSLPSTDGWNKASVDRVGEAESLDLKGVDLNPESNIFRWVTGSRLINLSMP